MLSVGQYAWISSNSVATIHLRKQTCSLIEYAEMARLHFVVLTQNVYGPVCLGHAMMQIVPVSSMLKWQDRISWLWRTHFYGSVCLGYRATRISISNTCSHYQDLNTNNHCMTTAYDLYLNFQASITLIKELRRILRLQFIVTILPNSH
jgi:hypothetical protein